MSDFKPAEIEGAAERPAPAPAPVPLTELDHLLAIAERIAAGFRHMAAVIPSALPLSNMATSIEMRVLRIRDMQPPQPGSTHDHS